MVVMMSTTFTFLLLGDADFSYSLDMARYVRQQETLASKIEVIATGIDSYAELVFKYRDVTFVLEHLLQQQEQSKLGIKVHHSVNALVYDTNRETNFNELKHQADCVIFNHPHLGTENARLHGQFLIHLFHAVANFWLKENDGVFHITLVEGQFRRWQCEQAARRHGMTLLGEFFFSPPPVDDNRYHYRRHQSGKSFASRRPDGRSITYTFARAGGVKMANALAWLPWQRQKQSDLIAGESDKRVKSFQCPFCEKEFAEERSQKCHIRDRHADELDKPEVQTDSQNSSHHVWQHWLCQQCVDESGNARHFRSKESLGSHMVAKHSGIHSYIAPDWSLEAKQAASLVNASQQCSDNMCPICDLKLEGRTLSEHLDDFVPDKAVVGSLTCTFCSKSFREVRAVQQHENFCGMRKK
jgi:hypothetical protein